MKKFTLPLLIIFIFYSCEKDELDFSDPIVEEAEIAEDNSSGFRQKSKKSLYN